MRALFITLLLAAVAVGGYFAYRQIAPAADEAPGLFAEQERAALPTAEECAAEHAVYEYNDDRRLELRFRRLPSAQDIELAEAGGQVLGNMAFVIRVTSFQTEYVFVPVNERPPSGPAYEVAVTYVRPAAGGQRIPVTMFDSQMHYMNQLPRNDSRAPGYIFMHGAMPVLYRDQIDQPPGVFRFQRCETPEP